MSVYDEFEKSLKNIEIKRSELKKLEDETKLLAAIVMNSASSPKEPVDVVGIIKKIGQGITVEKIIAEDPILSEGKINGYEGIYNAEVKKNAERLRKVIALAATVLAKGVMAAL